MSTSPLRRLLIANIPSDAEKGKNANRLFTVCASTPFGINYVSIRDV